ncbi:FxSxx-COOH system tetratricopeptide repeat protein [Streptomyces sp. NPDC002104]
MQVPAKELRPPAEVDAPHGLVNLPVRHASFVGRQRELDLLDAVLHGAGTAVVQALHGLGGVGKSALASHWAATRINTDNPVWWITADSEAGVEAGLASLAAALQPALAQLPQDQLTERAVQWLATHRGWLLILDNVHHPDHIARLTARATTGRILITSRRASGWHDIATPVPLDVLTPAEALELLSRILNRSGRTSTLDGAAELCEELGHLPLAVEQAASYIAESGLDPRAYLRLLADYPADMYREAGEGRDSERTIARIWRITLDRIIDTPLAGQILRILAWYAPEGIPRHLLDPLGAPPAVHQAVRRLAAYSMINANSRTLTAHRLVQAVARTPDAEDPHRQPEDVATALQRATACLASAIPEDWQEPVEGTALRTLLPHVEALACHAAPSTDLATTAVVLNRTGPFLAYQGQSRRAIAYLQRAIDCRERVLGQDAPDTLVSRRNLASAYAVAGDLARATPLFEATLDDTVRVQGVDHPDALTARSYLAYAYSSAGDLSRAIPLLEGTLDDAIRVLGEDDRLTLVSRNNLANAYTAAGEVARAIPLFERVLADRTRVLGADAHVTLISRNNLASAYQAVGDLGRAIPLFETTLADMQRVLGRDEPTTLSSRRNLAYAYHAAGDLGRAIPLIETTLADIERVLGEDSPDALAARSNLAGAYQAVGDVDRAVPLFETTLADMERRLGKDSPNTLVALNNLAGAYYALGDLERAIPLLQHGLIQMERVLGADAPTTLVARNNLASTYYALGDPERAIPLLRHGLIEMERVLGTDAPSTLIARRNLADTYAAMDECDIAIPIYEDALNGMERVWGIDHLETLTCCNNLASVYQAVEDLDHAIPLYEHALNGLERMWGADHPTARLVAENLAAARDALGTSGSAPQDL